MERNITLEPRSPSGFTPLYGHHKRILHTHSPPSTGVVGHSAVALISDVIFPSFFGPKFIHTLLGQGGFCWLLFELDCISQEVDAFSINNNPPQQAVSQNLFLPLYSPPQALCPHLNNIQVTADSASAASSRQPLTPSDARGLF